MTYLRIIITALFLISQPLPAFCEARYADGVYEGEYSFVKVQVAVKDGKINNIKMLHHGGGGKKYENMVKPLLSEMVKKQSTDVDAITGATVSSDHLQNAVNNALEKAER
jgi:uncharacterized protein with FMN-binding domain